MLNLKSYQLRALRVLEEYLDLCDKLKGSSSHAADEAFYNSTLNRYGRGIPYNQIPGLEGLPYVCVRVPTGGGKTLLACYAVPLAASRISKVDKPLVLWLTPSKTIREQTLAAFRNPRHPYNEAISSRLGEITVLDIVEALSVTKPTLDSTATIIVSTIQALRVEDTDGRKVYESSGDLISNFEGLPSDIERLLEHRNEVLLLSLCNVMNIRRPIVIVDEAHNSRTELSFDVLRRVNPSCVIEFTATPALRTNPSNVLHSVSSAELKAEAMIKIPIRLETKSNWKDLLSDAIGLRSQLEAAARLENAKTGEYLRPILLLQAQPHRHGTEAITVDVLKRTLLEDHTVPVAQVATATADEHGLDGVDLLAETCEIRYIITVQALREGWDCPFAYALCSVAELSSATAVEQILGRVMRLPRASRKIHNDLNMAYAFVSSNSFADTANKLKDALVESGYDRLDVDTLVSQLSVERLPPNSTGSSTAPPLENFEGSYSVRLGTQPDLDGISDKLGARVSYDSDSRSLTFHGVMSVEERSVLDELLDSGDSQAVEELYRRSRGLPFSATGPPAERGVRFSVPVLAIRQQTLLEPFEDSHVATAAWELSRENPSIPEARYSGVVDPGVVGELSIDDEGRLRTRFLSSLQRQMSLISLDEEWTVAKLAIWIDRAFAHDDVSAEESCAFIARAIQDLIDRRNLDIRQLAHDKYRLRDAVALQIGELRAKRRASGFQLLLSPTAPTPLVVDPSCVFTYSTVEYPFSERYVGAYQFQHHYYGEIGDLREGTEEWECAQFIDTMNEVDFWVRNLEGRPDHSFWLQTSTDKFYPDFVCRLKDGRFLVVEYKGEHLWSNDDSKEKRNIGEIWEARSDRRCLFIMPKGKRFVDIESKARVA